MSGLPTEIDGLILDSIRRVRRQRLDRGLGLLALGVFFALIAYATTSGPDARQIGAAIFVFAIFALIGAGFIVASRDDPASAKPVQLLRTRPRDSIVWIFAVYPRRTGAPAIVTVGFDDGELASVQLAADTIDMVVDTLRSYAPRASFGFSKELMRKFHSAPESLREELPEQASTRAAQGGRAKADLRDAAKERDRDSEMVELALGAGATNPMEYRRGMYDALGAARWGLLADPSDDRAAAMCSLVSQLALAVHVSMGGGGERPVGGALRPVPAGLGRDALARPLWADALWAATAGGDAPSAVRLAHVDPSTLPHFSQPTASELTAPVLAAIWRGADGVGRHLVEALEATDPAGQTDHRADELLDLAVPILQVLRHVDLQQPTEVTVALGRAAAAHAKFWKRHPPKLERDRVSLMLLGAARLAATMGALVPAENALFREVFGTPMPAALGCPVCANPADSAELVCSWCRTDLKADAPLDLAVLDVLGGHLRCRECHRVNRAEALRCWSCSTSVRST